MEKLVVTVACDSRTSYPQSHYCPLQHEIDAVATQYADTVKAGALMPAKSCAYPSERLPPAGVSASQHACTWE